MRHEQLPIPRLPDTANSLRRDDLHPGFTSFGTSHSEPAYLEVVREWGQSVEFGDSYLRGHSALVAEHTAALAATIGADPESRTAIHVGSFLHGVGRLRVPRSILRKPGVLTLSERAIIQRVPVWGAEILSKVDLPWDVVPIVRWHNERFDGTGYPDGLCGNEIPLTAQIVGIANVFVALTSPRAHRAALRPSQAIRELARDKHRWSRDVLETFLNQLESTYSGSLRLA